MHGSSARGKDGKFYIALTNLDPLHAAAVDVKIAGSRMKAVAGQILTAPAINSINTFDAPDSVKPQAFGGARLAGDRLKIDLPSKSIVVLALQ